MFQRIWYELGRVLLVLVSHLLLQVRIYRTDNLPAGPKIYTPNHPTTIDPAVVLTLVPEQTTILVLETLFKVPLLGQSMRMAGHIPVVIGHGSPAMETARQALAGGRSVMVFPEGAISPTGAMAKAHTGAARLALETGAPVIPVGIAVEEERIRRVVTRVDGKPEVGTWYFNGAYTVTFGEAMHFAGDSSDRDFVRQVTDQIVQRISGLSRYSTNHLHTAPALWHLPPRLLVTAFRWLAG